MIEYRELNRLDEDEIFQCLAIITKNYDGEMTMDFMFDLRQQSFRFIVAIETDFIKSDQVVGFGGYAMTPYDWSSWGVFWCNVRVDMRGKHIGHGLLQERIRKISLLGGSKIMACSKVQWHCARFGFKEITGPDSSGYSVMMLELQ